MGEVERCYVQGRTNRHKVRFHCSDVLSTCRRNVQEQQESTPFNQNLMAVERGGSDVFYISGIRHLQRGSCLLVLDFPHPATVPFYLTPRSQASSVHSSQPCKTVSSGPLHTTLRSIQVSEFNLGFVFPSAYNTRRHDVLEARRRSACYDQRPAACHARYERWRCTNACGHRATLW